MKYYRATIEVKVGKVKKAKPVERILYIKGEDITNAMDIIHKVRTAHWDSIKEITWTDYVNGVQNRHF